jgi:predicted nucleic acid-binding Zn ribbon protein
MSYRPRKNKFSRGQWEAQRDRFSIDAEAPVPIEQKPEVAIREPLQGILKSFGLGEATIQHQLMERWESITGQPLCRHTRPGPILGNTLTVYVTNSAMMAELSRFQGPALLKNIQAALGPKAINKLRFQIDPDTRRPAS